MRDKNTAAILALLLGGIGGHKFYLGQTGWGIVYLIFCWTFIPALVAFIEVIMLLTMSKETFDLKFNPQYRAQLAGAVSPQNIVVNVAQHTPALGTAAAGGVDVTGQLRQLHELKVAGALTEDEFNTEKRKLLTGRTG